VEPELGKLEDKGDKGDIGAAGYLDGNQMENDGALVLQVTKEYQGFGNPRRNRRTR